MHMYVRAQAPWKQRMAEEEGGEPHAAYAYVAANAAAKRRGQDLGCEVNSSVPDWSCLCTGSIIHAAMFVLIS